MLSAILLTSAFSLLVQACLTGGLDSSCSSKPKDCIDVVDLGPDRPSIVVIDARGRLGNHLMAYALVKALALDHGVVPLVTRETRDYLRDIFDYKDEVGVLEEAFCDSDRAMARMQVFEDTIDSLVADSSNFRGKFINLWPQAGFLSWEGS